MLLALVHFAVILTLWNGATRHGITTSTRHAPVAVFIRGTFATAMYL